MCFEYFLRNHERNRCKVQKDDSVNIRRENGASRTTLFIQKDDLVKKGNLSRYASHEVVHPQSFLYMLHKHIQKVKKVI